MIFCGNGLARKVIGQEICRPMPASVSWEIYSVYFVAAVVVLKVVVPN
jgi:hypothetical protein